MKRQAVALAGALVAAYAGEAAARSGPAAEGGPGAAPAAAVAERRAGMCDEGSARASAGTSVAREAGACAIVDALDELAADERAALRVYCGGEAAAPAPLIAGLFRMASQPAHRAAALAPILAAHRASGRVAVARPGADAPDLAAAQRRLAALIERLARAPAGKRGAPDPCAGVRRTLDAYAADTAAGEPAGAPLVADDPELRACLGDDGGPAGVRILAWPADTVREALVIAATPEFAAASWLGPADTLPVGGRRLFVAAVPAASAVAVVAQIRNAELPAAWRGLVVRDEAVWDAPPPMTCLSLDVALPPGAALFVDGAAVPQVDRAVARTFAVTRTAHQLVVVECDARGCFTRYEDTIAAERLARRVNECEVVRLDLRRRACPTVAILGANQGEACRDAPLRADALRRAATEYLERGRPRERYAFRDLAAMAAATDALVALRGRLSQHASGGGAETGADGVDLLGGAAHEAWRQGIDVLLSFELQCAPRGREWRYALEATRINLSSAFSRGALGGAGFDLTSFVETELEALGAAEQFEAALVRVIDRSLRLPYLRLLAARVVAPYRRGPELQVARFEGPSARRSIVVTAQRVAYATRPPICAELMESELRGPERVRRAEAYAALHGGRELVLALHDVATAGRAEGPSRVDRTRLDGPGPGWYVVLARWGDDRRAADALCVELTTSGAEVWVDAALSSKYLFLLPRNHPEQVYVRARVGYTRFIRPSIGVGAFFGYGYVSHVLPGGRPSWVDLGSLDMSALRWARHQFLAGGALDLRTRMRALPVDLRMRLTPTLGIGALRYDGIPPELGEFIGGHGGAANNIDLDFHLHMDLGYSVDVGRVTLANGLILGLDALDDGLRRVADRARDNASVFVGLVAGIGAIL